MWYLLPRSSLRALSGLRGRNAGIHHQQHAAAMAYDMLATGALRMMIVPIANPRLRPGRLLPQDRARGDLGYVRRPPAPARVTNSSPSSACDKGWPSLDDTASARRARPMISANVSPSIAQVRRSGLKPNRSTAGSAVDDDRSCPATARRRPAPSEPAPLRRLPHRLNAPASCPARPSRALADTVLNTGMRVLVHAGRTA